MNLIKLLPLLTFTVAMPTFAAEVSQINENNMIGHWRCQHQAEEPKTKMKVKVNYNINYAKQGKSSGSGTLLLNIPGMPELTFNETDKSSWQLKGDQLVMSSSDIKFTNVSHPQLDNFFNFNDILPDSINESGKVLALTASTLTVKSEAYGEEYSCARLKG